MGSRVPGLRLAIEQVRMAGCQSDPFSRLWRQRERGKRAERERALNPQPETLNPKTLNPKPEREEERENSPAAKGWKS